MSLPKFLLKIDGWAGRVIGLILGALAVLGQAPFHFWPIFLLSLGILFIRLQKASSDNQPGKRGFSVALWWGVGYFSAGTFWVGSAFIERGAEFIPIMPFMVAGLAFLLAFFGDGPERSMQKQNKQAFGPPHFSQQLSLSPNSFEVIYLADFLGICQPIFSKPVLARPKLRAGLELTVFLALFYL